MKYYEVCVKNDPDIVISSAVKAESRSDAVAKVKAQCPNVELGAWEIGSIRPLTIKLVANCYPSSLNNQLKRQWYCAYNIRAVPAIGRKLGVRQN